MIDENEYYGTIADANEYFANRLHEYAWSRADSDDRPKALLKATKIINGLNFKGLKATVNALLVSNPDATTDEIYAAESEQPLEFPRGTDTDPPDSIIEATYLIAYALLDGKDPEQELENLQLTSTGISSLRSTYDRNMVPLEHIINGVPSADAWRLIRPFLREDDSVRLDRAS